MQPATASSSAICPPFEWRPAVESDVPALAALYREAAFRIGRDAYSAEQVRAWASFADDRTAFGRYIQDHDTWVALRAGWVLPLGFCGIDRAGSVRDVHSLYVHPDAIRGGLGTEMLRRTLRRAQAEGAQRYTAWTSVFSQPVFLRLGFEWIETVRGEYAGVMFRLDRVERA